MVSKDLSVQFMEKVEKHWIVTQFIAITGEHSRVGAAIVCFVYLFRSLNLCASVHVLECVCATLRKSIFNTQMRFYDGFLLPSISRYPSQFFTEISMRGDQFWPCFNALVFTVLVLRLGAYFLLRWKVIAVR